MTIGFGAGYKRDPIKDIKNIQIKSTDIALRVVGPDAPGALSMVNPEFTSKPSLYKPSDILQVKLKYAPLEMKASTKIQMRQVNGPGTKWARSKMDSMGQYKEVDYFGNFVETKAVIEPTKRLISTYDYPKQPDPTKPPVKITGMTQQGSLTFARRDEITGFIKPTTSAGDFIPQPPKTITPTPYNNKLEPIDWGIKPTTKIPNEYKYISVYDVKPPKTYDIKTWGVSKIPKQPTKLIYWGGNIPTSVRERVIISGKTNLKTDLKTTLSTKQNQNVTQMVGLKTNLKTDLRTNPKTDLKTTLSTKQNQNMTQTVGLKTNLKTDLKTTLSTTKLPTPTSNTTFKIEKTPTPKVVIPRTLTPTPNTTFKIEKTPIPKVVIPRTPPPKPQKLQDLIRKPKPPGVVALPKLGIKTGESDKKPWKPFKFKELSPTWTPSQMATATLTGKFRKKTISIKSVNRKTLNIGRIKGLNKGIYKIR
jgi:hypothetical protein